MTLLGIFGGREPFAASKRYTSICYDEPMDENKSNTEAEHSERKPLQPITTTTETLQADNRAQPEGQQSKWRRILKSILIVTNVLVVVGMMLYLFIMFWLAQQSGAGVSGTEYVWLVVLMMSAPIVVVAVPVNLIGLPIYLLKYKVRGKWLVLGIISMIITLLLAAYGLYIISLV